jgi:hypothetical protein
VRDQRLKPPPARRAANQGPMFITDRGRPAHVLLSICSPYAQACFASLLPVQADGVWLQWPFHGHPVPQRMWERRLRSYRAMGCALIPDP